LYRACGKTGKAKEMMDATSGDFDHPMSFLLDEELNLPSTGEIRSGWVVAHRNNEILVDIGAKSEGIIDNREIATLSPEALESLAVGSEVRVFVVNPEDGDGNIVVSYAKAAEEKDWEQAVTMLESQELCECKVVGFNRGGILANVGRLRGFIPNSQLGRNRNILKDQENKQKAMQALVGKIIHTKIIEVDRERNRLILSERAASKELREERRAELLSSLKSGDVRQGRVVNMANFGAFIDIGGVEGLVHLSELSWKRVNHPSELLKVGDTVKAYVLNIDQERQRIALSIKRLEADPWTIIDETYRVGQLVEAEITRLTKFGAFARLNDDYELEGLIHISEMSEDRIDHPREVVKPEDKVMVRIIRIDPDQRQIGLSLRQVASEKYIESDLALLDAG
jgi:small subunit ribosomal protein S1